MYFELIFWIWKNIMNMIVLFILFNPEKNDTDFL